MLSNPVNLDFFITPVDSYKYCEHGGCYSILRIDGPPDDIEKCLFSMVRNFEDVTDDMPVCQMVKELLYRQSDKYYIESDSTEISIKEGLISNNTDNFVVEFLSNTNEVNLNSPVIGIRSYCEDMKDYTVSDFISNLSNVHPNLTFLVSEFSPVFSNINDSINQYVISKYEKNKEEILNGYKVPFVSNAEVNEMISKNINVPLEALQSKTIVPALWTKIQDYIDTYLLEKMKRLVDNLIEVSEVHYRKDITYDTPLLTMESCLDYYVFMMEAGASRDSVVKTQLYSNKSLDNINNFLIESNLSLSDIVDYNGVGLADYVSALHPDSKFAIDFIKKHNVSDVESMLRYKFIRLINSTGQYESDNISHMIRFCYEKGVRKDKIFSIYEDCCKECVVQSDSSFITDSVVRSISCNVEKNNDNIIKTTSLRI